MTLLGLLLGLHHHMFYFTLVRTQTSMGLVRSVPVDYQLFFTAKNTLYSLKTVKKILKKSLKK